MQSLIAIGLVILLLSMYTAVFYGLFLLVDIVFSNDDMSTKTKFRIIKKKEYELYDIEYSGKYFGWHKYISIGWYPSSYIDVAKQEINMAKFRLKEKEDKEKVEKSPTEIIWRE